MSIIIFASEPINVMITINKSESRVSKSIAINRVTAKKKGNQEKKRKKSSKYRIEWNYSNEIDCRK